MNNRIIYVIVSPERKFIDAFSNEEAADTFIELYSHEELRKEFYVLDGSTNYKPPVGKNVYFVKTNKDGSDKKAEIRPSTFFNVLLIGHISFDNFENMITNVWAKDEVEAKKLVDFIRTSIILKDQWGLEHDYK